LQVYSDKKVKIITHKYIFKKLYKEM